MNEGLPLLAVLIDADNVSARYADAIFEEIARFGEVGIRRIYGDFSGTAPQGWTQDTLAGLAIVPHQQFANTTGKNASDIALVIDAMDVLHTGRFDGFVLISSDSDFTRLAIRIREQGLAVYGMGERKTPAAFRNACKRFIYVENLVPEGKKPEVEASAAEVKPFQDPTRIVLRAMETIDQEDEWFHLGTIGNRINAANPDFDTRSYGKAKLSDLLRDLNSFEVRKEGTIMKVRRK